MTGALAHCLHGHNAYSATSPATPHRLQNKKLGDVLQEREGTSLNYFKEFFNYIKQFSRSIFLYLCLSQSILDSLGLSRCILLRLGLSWSNSVYLSLSQSIFVHLSISWSILDYLLLKIRKSRRNNYIWSYKLFHMIYITGSQSSARILER